VTHPEAPSRIVVLISGTGSIMSALIDAAARGDYGGRVVGVVADTADAPGLEKARAAGLATAVVRMGDFAERSQWDEAVARAVSAFEPDLVVLAGFMRILGNPMLELFGGRIINTHPALLPSFPGAHGVRDALAAGVKVSGCSVILIDSGVDTGPILAQAAVDVRDNDTEESLHERIKDRERELVVDVVGRMVREGWTVNGRRVSIGATPHEQGDARKEKP
jgi:phosphoribosylglycinamide formyltransferase-1